jgi:hypothetical protein
MLHFAKSLTILNKWYLEQTTLQSTVPACAMHPMTRAQKSAAKHHNAQHRIHQLDTGYGSAAKIQIEFACNVL